MCFLGDGGGRACRNKKSSPMATCAIRTMDHVSFGLIHVISNKHPAICTWRIQLRGNPPNKKRQLQETRPWILQVEKRNRRLFISILVGGNLNIFFNFHPKPWGNDLQFEEHNFQRGGEPNHQLAASISHLEGSER